MLNNFFRKRHLTKTLITYSLFLSFVLLTARVFAKFELSAEEKEFLLKHAPIQIGVMNNWPPFNYVDKNGNLCGIGAKYLELLNQKLGNVLVAVPDTFYNNYEKTKNKKLDALMDITPREEREPFFEFTDAYISIPHVIVGHKNGPYFSSEEDLEGKTVGLEKGYYKIIFFRKKYPKIKIKEYESTAHALNALAKGEVDAYAGNVAVVKYLIEKEGLENLELHGWLTLEPVKLTIGVRKDWPILAKILNKALQDIPDSQRKEIVKHYIAEPSAFNRRAMLIIAFLIGIFAILAILSYIFNFSLQYQVSLKTKKLQESEIKYRTLFESAGDAIFLMSKDVFLDCNQRALQMFGCRREELVGSSPYQFSPPQQPDGRPSKEKALEKINLAISEGPQTFEWVHCKADGTPFDAEVSLTSIQLGKEKLLLAIVRDITERKQVDQKLKQQLFELETFNKLTVGRELRLIELEKEVNALLAELNRPPKYKEI